MTFEALVSRNIRLPPGVHLSDIRPAGRDLCEKRVRLLLKEGANVDAANKTGFTALHHAAESGSTAAAETPLAAGADTTLCNRSGNRPADTARAQAHPDLAALIEAKRK